MSNILKGILNEISPHDYDSDWDYQDALARSGKPRSSYRPKEDDTFDADVAYSKKIYQATKAAKEKAQRDSDHDRLATGTNESITENDRINPIGSFPKGPKANRPTRPPLRTSAEIADMLNIDKFKFSRLAKIFPNFPKPVEGIRASNGSKLYYNVQEFNKWVKDNDILTFLKQNVGESLDDPWGDQGNFAGSKPVNLGSVSIKNIQVGDTVKYLGQPSKVVAMSKDRKYSRITISKGMGTVTQDVLTSDLQQLGRGTAIEENDNIQTRMRMNDYYDLADAIQEKLRQAIQLGDKERIKQLSKERDELDTRITKYGLMPESEQLDEISNEKLAQYKTAAAADAGKADKEGDYKRGDKRFSGIVKATKKQFANDTKKSGISQGINEFSPGATGPKGPKDYGQPNSSRYIGGNKFVVGTTNNYVLTATIDKWGLEWDEDDDIWFLDSPGAAHIADASEGEIELPPPREQRYQIHDLVTDYLNAHNLTDLQKVAAYYGHSDDGEMATNEEFRPTPGQANNIRKQTAQKMNPNSTKFVWKRPNQISGSHTEQELLSMGFRKSTKHNVWGGTQDMWNRLSSNLDENLGDQLKSTSLNALVQAKLAIEKQREADIEAWRQDFEKNTVQKAQQNLRKEFQPTPVSQPGEKHSVLKARLSQLNSAIQKQELLDKLVDKLERKGLMTPAMQNDTDTRMHVRYGAKDNYQSLNKKLDNAIATLQNRLNIRKISGLKENEEIVESEELDENLHKWFQEKWVRFGPDGKIRGDCARGDDSEGKPKCLPQSKAQNLGKKGRASAAARKRREDPNPERSGKAINVNTKKETNEEQLDELSCWSGYHRVKGTKAGFPGSCAKNKTNESEHSESCPHCGGEMVSEELMNEKKDACYYKVKSRYKVWPSAYASGALVKCRKKGASNWGTGGKSNESIEEGSLQVDSLVTDALKIMRGSEVSDAITALKTVLGDREYNGRRGFYNFYIKQLVDMYSQQGQSQDQLDEKWSKKYKDSINCSNPKGFSQKAHCAGKQKNESAIMSGLNQLDEGWKEKLGAAALAGTMALGAGSAHSRVTPDGQGGFTGGLKPAPTVTAPTDNKPAAEAPSGFSKEYLQKAADPNRTGRYLISVEKAQELLKSMP